MARASHELAVFRGKRTLCCRAHGDIVKLLVFFILSLLTAVPAFAAGGQVHRALFGAPSRLKRAAALERVAPTIFGAAARGLRVVPACALRKGEHTLKKIRFI